MATGSQGTSRSSCPRRRRPHAPHIAATQNGPAAPGEPETAGPSALRALRFFEIPCEPAPQHRVAELFECLAFELAHTLTGKAEALADLL